MDLTWLISRVVAVVYGSIFLYSFLTYTFDPFLQNSLFLQMVLILAFLKLYKKSKSNIIKIALIPLAITSVIPSIYISINYVDVAYRAGIPTQLEFVFGIITITAILALTWVFVGKVLTIIAAVFIVYSYLGNYIPGMWGHGGYPLNMLVGYLYMTREGLWSTPMSIAATYVVAFNIMGSLLYRIKTAKLIMDGLSPLSRLKGGPGIVAVLSNMFLGMVSGSAPENAALTGTTFQPLLRSYGFSAEKSAAIIAAAAAGALIMPPVMGAAAFLMADLLGITYRDIVIAAFLPGFLYFTSLIIHIYLDTSSLMARGNLKGTVAVDRSSSFNLIKGFGHTLIPLVVVTYFILVGYSPTRAAMYAIISAVLVSLIKKDTRLNLKGFIESIHEALDRVVMLGIAISAACLIYSSVMMTGLGLKLSLTIESLSAGNLFLALILIMISCIILGMGLPATVAYLIVAITIASAVVKLGIPPIAAHMFIFYFATFSTITPPVALALYTACAVFNSDVMKTGYNAIKIALPAFIVPFIFTIRPSLLALGTPAEAATSFITGLLGLISITTALTGYMLRSITTIERVIYGIAGILMIFPETTYLTDILGVSMLLVMMTINIFIVKKVKKN
ncbi:MAG: TRAP transporter fused permease subunit [Sulfolobales archaeon]